MFITRSKQCNAINVEVEVRGWVNCTITVSIYFHKIHYFTAPIMDGPDVTE